MIQIRIPSISHDQTPCFARVPFDFGGLEIQAGPFYWDNVEPGQTISLRSEWDSLSENPGMYGENEVSHFKVSGEIDFNLAHHLLGAEPLMDQPSWTINGDVNYRFHYLPDAFRSRVLRKKSGDMETLTETHVSQDVSTLHCYQVSRYASYGTRYVVITAQRIIKSAERGIYLFQTYQIGKYINQNIPVNFDDPKGVALEYLDPPDWKDVQSRREQAHVLKGWNPEPPSINIGHLRALIRYWVPNLKPFVPPKLKPRDDLLEKAIQSLDANDVNMIAFLRDLKDVKSLIPKLKNLASLSTLANNHLAVQYGILPTVDDLESIVDAFRSRKDYYDRNQFRILTSADTESSSAEGMTVTHERRVKVALSIIDPAYHSISEALSNIGAYPSLSNLWDLIPYSFVINWFLDVGSFLERTDTKRRISRLPIRYVTHSEKIVSTFDDTVNYANWTGQLHTTNYRRWVTPEATLSYPSHYFNAGIFDNWLEASALIIQRKTK